MQKFLHSLYFINNYSNFIDLEGFIDDIIIEGARSVI